MINWCKYKVLLIVIFCSLFGRQLVGTALENRSQVSKERLSEEEISMLDSLIARKAFRCQAIDPAFRDIYSFETENYYINICQLGDSFYYRRQAKGDVETLLIPAEAVFPGAVFQASDSKTTYFVGKNGDRHYSSVMHNDDEIVFEPELQSPPAVSSELAEANIAAEKTKKGTNVAIEIDDPQNAPSESARVCASEKSAFHPSLEGWQKLLGKSPAIANKYATNNGHDFIYDRQNPNIASIATKDGAIVNLDIATVSETIEKVCVQSIAEN